MAKKMISTRIEGDAELKRKLKILGTRGREALMPALHAGADVIETEAERRAPGPHIVRGNEVLTGGMAEIEIGPDEAHWHYRYAEFGASPHEITGKKESYTLFKARSSKKKGETPEPRKVLGSMVFQGRNGLVVTKRVSHPGRKAKPFLRNTMTEKQDQTVEEIGKLFKAEIDKLVVSHGG